MKIALTIPDELYDHFVKKHGVSKAHQVMRQTLEHFKDVDETDRYLVLAGDDRRAIEAIFQTTMDTPAKFIKVLKNMSTAQLGPVEIAFTDDELQRLKAQAVFHGRTLDQYITETATELKNRMMETC